MDTTYAQKKAIAKKKTKQLQSKLLIAAIMASNDGSYAIEGRLANRKRMQNNLESTSKTHF